MEEPATRTTTALSSNTLVRLIRDEENANTFTHALGLAMGTVAGPWLLYRAWLATEWAQWTGVLIFCASMLLVYAASTVYHAVRKPRAKRFFQVVDHISIFFLIAGTHTPFLVTYLDNSLGRFYLIVIWVLVGLGILYKLFFFGRWRWLSLAFYLGMGWMGALTIPSMWHQMSEASLYGIVIGGLSYTVGAIFFAWHKLPYHHAIWHLFVMGGTAGHFVAVWYAV